MSEMVAGWPQDVKEKELRPLLSHGRERGMGVTTHTGANLNVVCFLLSASVGLAIAAMILTSACKLVRVRPPEYFPAMGICLVVTLATTVVQVGLGVLVAMPSGLPEIHTAQQFGELIGPGMLLSLPLMPFISAAIFCVMIEECSFVKGLLVWLAQFAVILLFVGVIFVIALVFNGGRTGR